MTAEVWAALSAILLVMAAAAWVVQVLRVPGPWSLVAIAATAGAVLALVIALGLSASEQGGWSPQDRFQVTLGLTLAILLLYFVLAWRLQPGLASPVVELVGLALILVGVLSVQVAEPVLGFMQRTTPHRIHWVLFLLGSGAAMVAGCAGLTRGLDAVLGGRTLGNRPEQQALLKKATMLSVVVLGAGLTVSVWWAWRTMGTLSSVDPRQGWLTVGWLGAGMSLLAWRLERRWEQWAAGLAVATSVVIVLGVLGPWI